ncbi:MAG: DUF2125 domain-containing protein [Pseudomonadota bacterium]
MKWIFGTAVALAALWGGFWFVGASTVEKEAETWMSARQAEGWAAEVSSVETRGFPNRFDTTFTDIELVDPDTGWAWRAPMFQLLRLSYDAEKVIAVWPPEQSIATPQGRINVTSKDMRASADFANVEALEIDSATWTAETLGLTPEDGAGLTIDKALMALRRQAETKADYDLALTLTGLTPSKAAKAKLDPSGLLPQRIEKVVIDGVARFDRAWDRSALEKSRPQPTSLTLKEARAAWGPLSLRFAGDVEIDAQGRATGKVSIKAENWVEMLDLAQNAGALNPDLRPLVEGTLQLMAGFSGSSKTLDVPITLSGGKASVGFIPLGEAPRLRLR